MAGIVESPFLREEPDFDTVPIEDNRAWYFIVIENTQEFNRGDRISGQFTAQQVTENREANLPEAGGYSRSSPIIQWVGGRLLELRFQARLFSEHAEDNTAMQKRDMINALQERDTILGRPPLIAFFWGSVFGEGENGGIQCFISSVSSSFDELRDDGTLRGITLDISLKRWTQYTIEQTSLSRERTPTHEARHGETYEMIAMQQYGDPLLGVLLRQMNPRSPMVAKSPRSVADLSPGDNVKIYNPRELNREKIRPMTHILRQDNYLVADNRRYFFNRRARKFGVIPSK